MQTVRAKFVCQSVEDFGSMKKAKLVAVYGTREENKDFTDATPSGTLEIMINGEVPASEFFKPGKQYYLDFTESN